MINKEKLKEAKELFKISKNTKNKYVVIFNVLKEDIKKLKEVGLSYKAIAQYLSKEFNTQIKTSTLANWYQRNCKTEAKATLNKKEKETESSAATDTNTEANDEEVIDSFFEKAKKLTKK